MFYKVQRVDGRGSAAAFSEESTARHVKGIFNDRYQSDYEIVEDPDPLASQIGQATVIAGLELGI